MGYKEEEIKKLNLKYFNGKESETYAFLMVPKAILYDKEYEGLKLSEILIYSSLLERMKLGGNISGHDELGRAYVYCSLDMAQQFGHCKRSSAITALKSLEARGMIEKDTRCPGSVSRFYVKNFLINDMQKFKKQTSGAIDKKRILESAGSSDVDNFEPVQNLNYGVQNLDGGSVNFESKPVQNLDPYNNKNIKNINNNLIPIYPSKSNKQRVDGIGLDEDAWAYRECVDENIETEVLCKNYPHDAGTIRGIADLMVDVLTSSKEKMVIGGEERSTNVVKGRFMKLTRFHIEDVLDNWNKLTEPPVNPRQYLLAMLYNVSTTADAQFTAVLNRDARSNFQDLKKIDNTDCDDYMEG